MKPAVTILIFILCWSGKILAVQPADVNQGALSYDIIARVSFYEDTAGELDLEDIVRIHNKGNFIDLNRTSRNFGNTKSVFWVHFTLPGDSVVQESSESGELYLRMSYPHFNYIDLYSIDAAGTLHKRASGLKRNPKNLAVEQFMIPLSGTLSGKTYYFVRLQSQAAMILDFGLERELTYLSRLGNRRLILGVYYGVIAAMILYNIFLFLSVREKVYLIYVLFVASYGLYQFHYDGFARVFLYPNHQINGLVIGVFFGLSMIFFGNLFTNSFLNLKKNSKFLHYTTLVFVILSVFHGISFFLVDFRMFNKVTNQFAVFQLAPTMLVAGLYLLNKGYGPARYFTLASGIFALGVIIRMLKNLGFIGDSFLTSYSMHLASVAEMTLLSLALGDRINILKNQYRGMAQKLLGVQDEERERIARDLHDSLGQYLTTAKLQNSLTKISLSGEDESTHGNVSEVDQLLGESIDECHRIAYELSPPSIQKFGLLTAIRDLIESYENRMGIQIALEENLHKNRLTEKQETALYRIVQEALNNILKYSEADYVKISLLSQNNQITMSIQDNGVGFNLEEQNVDTIPSSGKGLGLLSMQERANNLDGEFQIHSKPGEGTGIRVTVPL